jgi:hypothetical protein
VHRRRGCSEEPQRRQAGRARHRGDINGPAESSPQSARPSTNMWFIGTPRRDRERPPVPAILTGPLAEARPRTREPRTRDALSTFSDGSATISHGRPLALRVVRASWDEALRIAEREGRSLRPHAKSGLFPRVRPRVPPPLPLAASHPARAFGPVEVRRVRVRPRDGGPEARRRRTLAAAVYCARVHAGVRRAAAAHAAHEDAVSTTDLLDLWEFRATSTSGRSRKLRSTGSRRRTFARTSCPGIRSARRPR